MVMAVSRCTDCSGTAISFCRMAGSAPRAPLSAASTATASVA
jgi:hypothetical protein